jgi:DNA-binding NarL/FixJ family response regulator
MQSPPLPGGTLPPLYRGGAKRQDFCHIRPARRCAQGNIMTDPTATGERHATLHRLIVVEDDVHLRAHALRVLTADPALAVVGEAGTLADGLALVDSTPSLALLDLGLPDGNGQMIIEALHARAPACKVLVFTVFEDRASVINALRAGADGYILKDASADQLLGHVHATLAGETPISARAASHLLSLVRSEPVAAAASADTPPAPTLSPREQELLEYFARGLSRKEAARVMSISPYTVAEYVQGIYRKLQVRSRGEAVFEAIQSGMIRLDNRA